MSYARTLQRKLDIDLIDQIEAYGAVERRKQSGKTKKMPRAGSTYRGARRNRIMGRT